MMPGPHIPPAVPIHQGRRQSDYHYHIPPQTHSPVPHNPYVGYHHPQYHGQTHASPYPQQWYPYHQPQHQYQLPSRQYQSHSSPVVVSSHPHMQPVPPVNRQLGQTPPIVHTRTPPVARNLTPQPTPSTPSVTSQAHVSPPTPTTTVATPTPPPLTPSRPSFSAPPPPQQSHRMPFYPPLPWYSVPDAPFPPRSLNRRRRRRGPVAATEEGLAFPTREQAETTEEDEPVQEQTTVEEQAVSQTSTAAPASDLETPATSQAPSEADSTQPTTPSSALPPPSTRPSAPVSHTRTATKPVVPIVPIKPVVPNVGTTQPKPAASVTSTTQKSGTADKTEAKTTERADGSQASTTEAQANAENASVVTSPPAKLPPKSWADLVRTKAAPSTGQSPASTNGAVLTNGSGTTTTTTKSVADVLGSFSVDSDKKVAFLEPRGLVNTGNMCYMNSILQVLVFCVPFYDFLDQVGKRAVHSFKSETPLVDAMIEFMREFNVIDSAVSPEKLRLRLKDAELEQYGEPLTPEYVYDVIKRLPRFKHMTRGHQQDAEEFLGFLLAGLHDECAQVLKSHQPSNGTESVEITSPISERSGSVEGGWLEVGPKQKSAITRSSGTIEIESPVTKIFGGKLRSEYRVPGDKPSVTLEPYQPLQLDIGAANVHNITDALGGLTRLETLQGEVNSPRGYRALATKQVFIETLPPVLILHLKRFQYDTTGGAQKIWKKIGYPLELEIPKEVFPAHKRGGFAARGGLPRYRLTGVVYHHGKNASGGHYTVDVLRQEEREWIRMDDTIIRRIRSEDVAEGGSEEDPRVLAAALENHKRDQSANRNFYEQVGLNEEEEKAEGGWSQVNGLAAPSGAGSGPGKKWSGVVNGTSTPSTAGKRTPGGKEGVKDNKVAYILFYQQIKV